MHRNAPSAVAPVFRPRSALGRTALLALLLASVAMFGPLYLITIPQGSWPATAIIQGTVTLLFVAAYLLYRRTRVLATRDDVVAQSFFGRTTRFSPADVSSVVLARTYRSGASDTVPQLVMRDVHGERMLRLRGQFWSEPVMRQVASAAGLPLMVIEEPLSSAEFFERVPGAASWFENRLSVRVAFWVGVVGLCAAAALGLMRLLGIPAIG